ncbi:MAG: UDP-N-acetylglucosamine 2-epimerase [Halobacteriovoraceae bacterium]|nr:UDP-N-acetylglucosamine 2-epimerase [Halobacteriovoraceae bacterium]
MKVCVITGARSEYGLLTPLLKKIDEDHKTELQLVVTGMHLSEKFGYTIGKIKADGFKISAEVPLSVEYNEKYELGKNLGDGLREFSNSLEVLKPDVVIIMGDRFELLSIVPACMILGIPIAHISGGEVTEGAIDDQIRHMTTKAAALHFTSNEVFSSRLIQMGEEAWRVHTVGEPGLDFIKEFNFLKKEELEKKFKVNFEKKTCLLTLHPTTHELDKLKDQIEELVKFIQSVDYQFIITYPNADPGCDLIIEKWKQIEKDFGDKIILIKSLGQENYFSMLKHINIMIGNTSSGLVESPTFGLPTINIGNRQAGRICAGNVFNSDFDHKVLKTISEKLEKVGRANIENPYGDGNSSGKILRTIKETFRNKTKEELLAKKFIDIKF